MGLALKAEEQHSVTGREVVFPADEIIVSKTDPRGIMTYVNDIFLNVSGYAEDELIGKPHSLIRHPEMPRAVFKLLWDTIKSGNEIFAYVMNRCKNGDHYWVLAHVTPSFNSKREIIGFHSSRRVPTRQALEAIRPIYQQLLAAEQQQRDSHAGLAASTQLLQQVLASKGKSYNEFIFTL